MRQSPKALKPAANARISDLPVKQLLAVKFAETGLSNAELANKLGYESQNIISMLKAGSMRVPINKVAVLAEVTDIDPVFLLEKVMNETQPEVWDALKTIIGNQLLTTKEMALIDHIRASLNGVEVDLTDDSVTRALDPVLSTLKKREAALINAAVEVVSRPAAG